jgi:preprotein translocase subunit SecG
MYQVIIVVHVLLGLGIIGLILMQQGKGADAGAAFGSGSSGSVFGAQGAASFLSRTTAILATLFFTTSLTLAVLNGQQSKKADLMDTVEVEQKTTDVPLAKTATDAAPVAPASDTPAVGVSTEAPVSVTATPVVDSEKKDSSVPASKVDTDSKTADNKAGADVTTKSEKADSNKKQESDKKKAADKKSEKKHESDKKKSSDKHEKKHESDADKKDKK